LVQWQNLSQDQAAWEDKLLIKVAFPEFYYKTIKWWPEPASSGQEASQGGGNCHDWRLYDQVNMMNGG
jgi:hypothetical protein